LTGHFAGFEPHVHLATPRRKTSTVANTVATQIMFRRFDVTTRKKPDRSDNFHDLRGLLFRRVPGFLFAIVIPVSRSSGI